MPLQKRARLNRLTALLAVLTLVFHNSPIVKAELDVFSNCSNMLTCHECLQIPACTWCEKPDYNGPRCMFSNLSYNCTPKYSIKHKINVEKIVDRELSFRAAETGRATLIRPQNIALKMPKDQAYHLQFEYFQIDFPIDVYFMVDLSNSSAVDVEKHFNMIEKVTQTVEKLTSNYRLGFGSFYRLNSEDDTVAYSHFSFETDSIAFRMAIQSFDVPSNLNKTEGGLKVLMQALVCHSHINWREEARRILIFSTDADVHYAGDGKSDSILTPNDGECHLDEKGLYNSSFRQNYPSMAQINQKVLQVYVNIIFAVPQKQYLAYERLTNHIEGSSSAILSNDSFGVVELVKAEYGKISSSVEMKDNATRHVKITYYSACLTGGAEMQTSKCYGLKVGDVVRFTAEIQILSCPTDQTHWEQNIEMFPKGSSQSLVIDLTMLCACDCENPNHRTYEENSLNCNGSGTYMCGSCSCDETHFGRNCENKELRVDDLGCRADNMTSFVCSGRGVCIDGQCKCDRRASIEEVISGKYCECDNFSCERYEGLLCAGPDHGRCECGQCHCLPEWEGFACDCLKSKEPCIPPNGGEICSGHGECECGQCKCKSTEEGRYSGKYCEKCPTCQSQRRVET